MAACLSETLPFFTCDVFTVQPFAGNPLAIVEDAGALSTAQMQIIAREFNLSETIFVLPPRDARHTARVRIFFPTAEIPFAGHPTIGCAIHLALRASQPGDFETRITLEEEAGLVPVTVSRNNGRVQAELTAPIVPHKASAGQIPTTELLAAMLGLTPGDIGFADHRPGLFEGGPRFLYVPLRDLDALAAARASEPQWSNAMKVAAVDSAYIYTLGVECDYRARMFSPTAGIPEDPATGSASAILAAQLHAQGLLGDGATRLTLHQGIEMGRPSEITLTVHQKDRVLKAVQVAGSAVFIAQGSIAIPRP